MGYLSLVQKFDPLDYLIVKKGSLFLLQSALLHYVVEKFATLRILHNHVNGRLILYNVIQLDNVPMLDLFQYFDLAVDSPRIRHLRNFLATKHLYRHFLTRPHMDAQPHLAESALAQVPLQGKLADLLPRPTLLRRLLRRSQNFLRSPGPATLSVVVVVLRLQLVFDLDQVIVVRSVVDGVVVGVGLRGGNG